MSGGGTIDGILSREGRKKIIMLMEKSYVCFIELAKAFLRSTKESVGIGNEEERNFKFLLGQ